MKKVMAAWMVALAVLAGTVVLTAHHSLVQFDTTSPVWVKGTVVRFDRITPHARVYLDQTEMTDRPSGGPWTAPRRTLLREWESTGTS